MSNILVTGGAGFIGMHTVLALLQQGHNVVSIDNLNDYYDVKLKKDRLQHVLNQFYVLKHTQPKLNYAFFQTDVADTQALASIFATHRIDYVCHLAAQAGVRYSIENPQAYIQSNLQGFANILEMCRQYGLDNHENQSQQGQIKHLVYASSSSIYGNSKHYPYTEDQNVDHPVSLYAATKKSNELMAHAYSHLYQLPTSGLRFFTVYGEWGRPDMAYFKFTKTILAGKKIDVYNHGDLARDFTYIDDIVEGICRCIFNPPKIDVKNNRAAYDIYNIGHNHPVKLLDFIETLEKTIGTTAQKNMLPMQDGDVYATHANIDKLNAAIHFVPKTTLNTGLTKFYDWYQAYYHA